MPSAQSHEIHVDRAALLQFMQFRLKAFQPQLVGKKLDAMPSQERKRLIDDYVQEEVLYRESLAMGLDRNDYVLKQRIIQRVTFALRGLIEDTTRLSDTEVRQWYHDHPDDYRLEPAITFTHVFFSTDSHSREAALALAESTLKKLRKQHIPFAGAMAYGDRFPYHTNYVERDRSYVESQFGKPMSAVLFTLKPTTGHWYGPFQSPYGFHLVQVTALSKPGEAPLQSIRQRVIADARRDRINRLLDKNIKTLIESYDVSIDGTL